MSMNLPLETMTVGEKLYALESIWASLCQTPTEIGIPEWHAEILDERSEKLTAGTSIVTPWEEAKQRLQDLGQ